MKKKLIMLLSFAIIACVFAFNPTYKTNEQTLALTIVKQSVINSEFTSTSSIDGCFNETYECAEVPTASVENSMSTSIVATDVGDLPTEYCLRDDYIIYTQNQDVFGFCWNFASSMALTTTIMKATNEYYDFSEAYIGVMADDEGGSYFGHGGVFLGNYPRDLLLEADLPYEKSYEIYHENIDEYVNYCSTLDKFRFKDENWSTVTYNTTDYFNQRELIKNHIYNYGGLYLSYCHQQKTTKLNEKIITYLDPTYNGDANSHAVTLIGWDDDIQIEIPSADGLSTETYTGAWIALNSWNDTFGNDGIFYLFYESKQDFTCQGYVYNKLYESNYFYTSISEGYDYTTTLKGEYYNTLDGKENLTKQKNIFYDNQIDITYSYEIPENGDVESIEIIHNGTDVASQFSIKIDTENNTFNIFGTASDVGTYKLLVHYSIDDYYDVHVNNFYVMNGFETSQLKLDFKGSGFKNLPYLEFQSYTSDNNDEYTIYTNNQTGSFNVNVCWSGYSVNMLNSYYPSIRQVGHHISYNSGEFVDNICIKTLTFSKNGKSRIITFKITYESENKNIVNVEYNLNGGTNNQNNTRTMIVEKDNSLLLEIPQKEGYTFTGWYVYNSENELECLNRLNSQYVLSWKDIKTTIDNPYIYTSYKSEYKTYYKNINYVLLTAIWTKEEKFAINLNYEDELIESVYLSTNSKAISGDASGTSYQYGTRVYYFIQVIKENKQHYYTIDGAELIADRIYLVGFVVVEGNITITLPKVIQNLQTYEVFYNIGDNIDVVMIYGQINEKTWGYSNKFVYGTTIEVHFTISEIDGFIYDCDYDYTETPTYGPLKGKYVYIKQYEYLIDIENNLGTIKAVAIKNSFTVNAELGVGVENIYTSKLKNPENLSDLNSIDTTYKCSDQIYLFLEILDDSDEFNYEIGEEYLGVTPTYIDAIDMYLIGFTEFKNSNVDLGTISATKTRKKYLVNYEKDENALEVYMSKDYNGQTKDDPNKEYEYGTELFCFVTIPEKNQQYSFSFNGINIKDNLYLVKKFTVLANNNLGLIEVVKTINKFKTTFNANGGTLISGNISQTIYYGATASAPLLTREGYTQDGWDKPLTNIIADTTITAKWKPITYTIAYNLMGGTNHSSNPTNYTIESDTTVLQNPTYEGYNFGGWYYNSNFDGERVYTINQGSIGDLNLYAKFIAIECSVVFDLDSSRFGNISCINGDLDNLEYGDSLTFEVTTDTGYEVDKVFVNDVETIVTDNKFTVSNIQENTNIRVTYKESSSIVIPPNKDNSDMPNNSSGLDDNAKYIIYAGIGLIVLLLTVLIIITSKNNKNKKKILAMNNNKDSQYNSQSTYNHSQPENTYAQHQRPNLTYNSQKAQQVFNNKSNINQQPNPMLQKALDFVKGKEHHFESFCNRYKIDYKNNYNNAVLKYYQAYLRSIKK